MNSYPPSSLSGGNSPLNSYDPESYKETESRKGCIIAGFIAGLALLLLTAGLAALFLFLVPVSEDKEKEGEGLLERVWPSEKKKDPLDQQAPAFSVGLSAEEVINDILPNEVKNLEQPLLPLTGETSSQSLSLPSEDELTRLARDSLESLNAALLSRDFTAFHATVSAALQAEQTPESLQAAFQDFITKRIDLRAFLARPPVFTRPPHIDEQDLLHLQGHFPGTQPLQFTLVYINENENWKLYSISIKILSPAKEEKTSSQLPSSEEAEALAEEAILALEQAVKSGDFQSFYQDIALFWQRQTTPEKLKKAFHVFIERPELDLGSIRGLRPEFSRGPEIDRHGWLIFSGTYPSRPYPIHFDLGFLREEGEWKLVKINVEM